MIKTLELRNFKSVKQLKLDCERINIFIGEPNTGKSNILEALGVYSFGGYSQYSQLPDFVRFERVSYLFYDENLGEKMEIRFDDKTLQVEFRQGNFHGTWHKNGHLLANLGGNYDSLSVVDSRLSGELSPFKFYRFTVQKSFPRLESDFLLPPSGSNLLSLLLTHKELRETANQLFSSFGLRLGLRPQEGKIEVVKQFDDIIISYPYSLSSDTLQRLVFYLTAVLSNQESILVFEEPESHAFPYYTKYLAETIALDDKNNQYFISTHNPYFLLPLLEKVPKEGVAVFITYYRDYQTKAKRLSAEEMGEILDIDVFSNLDRYLERR